MRFFVHKLMVTSGLMLAVQPIFGNPAVSLEPILALEADLETLPFLDLALRDPAIELRAANVNDAKMLVSKVQDLEIELAKATSKKAQLKLTGAIFRGYLTLVSYTEDIDHSLIDDERVGRRGDMRAKLLAYATKFASLAPDPADKLQARYHIIVSKLLSGKDAEAFAEISYVGETTGPQAMNLELLRAMAELNSGAQEAGRARLTKVLPKLNGPAGIVAMLLLARSLAGIDSKGAPVLEANPEYGRYLTEATKRAAALGETMRSEVFAYALGVWRGAEGVDDWRKQVIAPALFKGLDEELAVEERLALAAASSGRYAEAIQRYAPIVHAFKGLPELAPLTERILDLHARQADQTGQTQPYRVALAAAEREFATKTVLGKDQVKTALAYGQKFQGRYRTFILTSLDRAADKRAADATRANALALGRDYLGRSLSEKDNTEVSLKVAQVHVAAGQFHEAAEMYLGLSEWVKGPEGLKFLRLAIEAQSALANWPLLPPWDGAANGSAMARLDLAEMYEELHDAMKAPDATILAHIGLLKANAGQADETYAYWMEALKYGPRGEDAARVASWLMQTAQANKKWGDLVYIVHYVQTHKMTPAIKGRVLDPAAALADGLYYGGHAALKKGEHVVAAKFFGGFMKQFPNDLRYVDALIHRSKAQAATGDLPGAVAGLREVINNYPQSSQYRDAVVEGRRMATGDDDRAFFYEAYLKTLPKAVLRIKKPRSSASLHRRSSRKNASWVRTDNAGIGSGGAPRYGRRRARILRD